MLDDARAPRRCAEYADAGWLVLAYDGSPEVRIDLTCAERVLVDDGTLTIAVGSRSMSMGLSGGPAKAQQLLSKLSPYTRSSPIVDHEQYAEAKRLLDDVLDGRAHRSAVTIDGNPVLLSGAYVSIGDVAFLLSELESYSLDGHYLPLPSGPVRAAVVMLAVYAMGNRADPDLLKRRMIDYERTNVPGAERT